jgi:hypothetical protein
VRRDGGPGPTSAQGADWTAERKRRGNCSCSAGNGMGMKDRHVIAGIYMSCCGPGGPGAWIADVGGERPVATGADTVAVRGRGPIRRWMVDPRHASLPSLQRLGLGPFGGVLSPPLSWEGKKSELLQ